MGFANRNGVITRNVPPVPTTTGTTLGISWGQRGVSLHVNGEVTFTWKSDRGVGSLHQTDQLWAVADIWGTNEIKIVDFFPTGIKDIDLLVMQFINVQYITVSNVRRH